MRTINNSNIKTVFSQDLGSTNVLSMSSCGAPLSHRQLQLPNSSNAPHPMQYVNQYG